MSTIKLEKVDKNFFKKYDRKFIQLNKDIVILIHIFEKNSAHTWEDIWLQDSIEIYKKDTLLYEEAAKQFIKQLKGHYCISFLEALRNECDKHVQKYKEQYKKFDKNENSSNK